MLRSLCLPLLGFALFALPAVAQTTPAARPAPRKTTTAKPKAAAPTARRANPLSGTNDNGVNQSGYAAPGEPIQDPRYNGKNTPPYDGPATRAKRNTTLSTTPK